MPERKFSGKEILTFSLLFFGYIGYYLTRKNITIAVIDMKRLGLMTQPQIGYLFSLGTLFYALGKFSNGFIADLIGGKRMFCWGMCGSILASTAFASCSSYGGFLVFWAINSYFLSMGWAGLIKVCSYWFAGSNRGTIIGWMSLNYQLGSSISKAFATFLMGYAIFVWRGLFWVPAAVLLIMAIAVAIALREKPENNGQPWQPPLNPGAEATPQSMPTGRIWLALIKSPAFLLLLWASAALTLIRTFLEDFTALWLNSSGMDKKTAGYISALFTIGGMIGTVAIGYISDRINKGNRAPAMVVFCMLLGILLFLSGYFPKNSVLLSTIFFSLAGMLLYAVYSILGGVSAIDFGGNIAPATAAGIMDGAGYLAAVSAGLMAAEIKIAQWEDLIFWFAVATVLLSLSLTPLWKIYPTKAIS